MIQDDILVKEPLEYWQEILEEWIFINKRTYRITNKQLAPYGYKERTNIGVLADAAVKTGWIALEECRSEKIAKHDKSKTGHGRSDLLLWRDIRHDHVEAKLTRVSLKSPTLKRINTVFSKAKRDVMRTTKKIEKEEKLIALTFIVPWVKKDVEYNDGEIEEFIIRIKKEIDPTIFVCVFPGKVELVGAAGKYGLGVILIGNHIS